MPIRRFARVLLAAALALPGFGVAGEAAGGRDIDAAARQLIELAEAGRDAELASRVAAARNRPDWTDVHRERVLYAFATGVRQLPAARVPVTVLKDLTDYRSRVLVAHPESRGALMLPRFDVAGAAAGSIAQAERQLRLDRLAAALASDPGAFWSGLADHGPPGDLPGPLQTALVAGAPAEALVAGRGSLRNAWRADGRLTPAAGAAALRLSDEAMAAAVLARETGPHALELLTALPSAFDDDTTFSLLRKASRRPELASAAVSAMAGMAPRIPVVRAWLENQLDDAGRGPAAAAVLAGLGEPSMVEKASADLVPSKSAAGLRNRVLLLHLSGTPEARRALSDFAADPAMPVSLRQEVRQWQ